MVFIMLHPSKQYLVLKVSTENKVFSFWNSALRAGIACNKRLKQAPMVIHVAYTPQRVIICQGEGVNSNLLENSPKSINTPQIKNFSETSTP